MDALSHYQALADEAVGDPPMHDVKLTFSDIVDLQVICDQRTEYCRLEAARCATVVSECRYWIDQMRRAIELAEKLNA